MDTLRGLEPEPEASKAVFLINARIMHSGEEAMKKIHYFNVLRRPTGGFESPPHRHHLYKSAQLIAGHFYLYILPTWGG